MNIDQLLKTDPAKLQLGQVVDAYKVLNSIRLLMQKEVDAVEVVEKAYRQHIIDNLAKSNTAGVFGLKYKATIKTNTAFRVDTQAPDGGWTRVYDWIHQNDRYDLLQKRLSDTALADMVEAGEPLPSGIVSLKVPEVSITKIT